MVVDYEFYINEFCGDTGAFNNAGIWSKYEKKAEDKLDYLTFARFKKLTEYTANVKKALCSLADALYAVDTLKAGIINNNGNIVSSMSSLGVSVSYANDITSLKKAACDSKEEHIYLRNAVKEYLQGSGLLYAGF